MKKNVIIGLGNPILRDDSVGIKVARELNDRLRNADSVEVKEVYAGGIRLLDALVGYDHAIIIDAIRTGENQPGKIHRLSTSDVHTTWNSVSVHDMSLSTALEMGAMLEMPLPRQIDIWGIEGADLESFSEFLTDEVACAVPRVVEEIVGHAAQWIKRTHSIGVWT